MKFIIDAQLPKLLAQWLRERGCLWLRKSLAIIFSYQQRYAKEHF